MKYFERKISVEDKMNLAVSFIIEGRFDIEKLRDSLDLIVKNSISSEEELAHIREMQEYWDKENEGHKQIVDVTPVKGTACNYEPFFTVDLEMKSIHIDTVS